MGMKLDLVYAVQKTLLVRKMMLCLERWKVELHVLWK